MDGDPEDIEWVTLKGATHAAFQPDATLVGRRLRCIITILPPDHESDNDGSDLDDVDLNLVDPEVQVCELPEAITADSNLFNGARQALVRGAKLKLRETMTFTRTNTICRRFWRNSISSMLRI